jgi:L-ascorbate metabolism protein UlaG (beta-lactamase superfamily)
LRRWHLGLAFLPINGRDAKRLAAGCLGNMTYQEAADLAGSLRPGVTVPTHFEMFAMNSEDPRLFAEHMRVKYPDLALKIPELGVAVDAG